MNTKYLVHHGVDGQKWGVRNGPPYPLDYRSSKTKKLMAKAEKTGDPKIKEKAIDSLDADFSSHLNKNWLKSYNEAADISNKKIDKLNEKYNDVNLNEDLKAKKEYYKEFVKIWETTYKDVLIRDFGEDPSNGWIEGAKDWIYGAPFYLNNRLFYEEEVGEVYEE